MQPTGVTATTITITTTDAADGDVEGISQFGVGASLAISDFMAAQPHALKLAA